MNIDDVNKYVDGVILFYSRYPVKAIYRMLGKDAKSVRKLVCPQRIEGIKFTTTPYIRQQQVLEALRRYLADECIKTRLNREKQREKHQDVIENAKRV